MTLNGKVNLLGVEINNVSVDEVIKYISNMVAINKQGIISNVNVHALNIAYKKKWFRDFLNDSQLVFCDGYGVHLGAFITKQKLNYRLTPPDWLDTLCNYATKAKWPLFFLGAEPGVTEIAAKNLFKKHPGLIIYTHHGFFNHTGEENEQVINLINGSNAKILFVGMGMPKQEKWIKDNLYKLSNVHAFLPVGAMFDYIANVVPRGPKWMTDHGFEWLARLIIEPRRLWKRYIIGNPVFLWRVLMQRFGILKFKDE